LAAFFNKKAKQSIEGRKGIFEKLKSEKFDGNWIWMHCASLGEFEQGRPLIEKIKAEQPTQKIILTFFSPSGFEIRKNYDEADCVVYLPYDSPSNTRQFLDIVKPQKAIFVKYEFWHFYLKKLKKRKIPTYLISAVFRKEQSFFKWYGRFFRNMLSAFSHIFTQDENSIQLLKSIDFENAKAIGDTRVDRVLKIANSAKQFPEIEAFCNQSPILICGSTWPPDEAILAPFINQNLPKNWKVIIAPHDIKTKHIEQIQEHFTVPTNTYTNLEIGRKNNAKVLIINNIGMLSSIYQYGKIAYIGGGFGNGIHNTLEPIAFGLPVIFGTKFQKFTEAVELVKTGGGFSISNQNELEEVFEKLLEKEEFEKASSQAQSYISTNQGATLKIYEFLFGTHRFVEEHRGSQR